MRNQLGNNVIEFPGEYLIEQHKRDRWLMIASCAIVMGSDEPMASVEMILDKFGDAPNRKRNAAAIIAHVRFSAKALPEALIKPDGMHEAGSATANVFSVATENVFNEWIDEWLPPPHATGMTLPRI